MKKKTYVNTEYVSADPSTFLYNVLNGHSDRGYKLAKLCDAAGTVADFHFELD